MLFGCNLYGIVAGPANVSCNARYSGAEARGPQVQGQPNLQSMLQAQSVQLRSYLTLLKGLGVEWGGDGSVVKVLQLKLKD